MATAAHAAINLTPAEEISGSREFDLVKTLASAYLSVIEFRPNGLAPYL